MSELLLSFYSGSHSVMFVFLCLNVCLPICITVMFNLPWACKPSSRICKLSVPSKPSNRLSKLSVHMSRMISLSVCTSLSVCRSVISSVVFTLLHLHDDEHKNKILLMVFIIKMNYLDVRALLDRFKNTSG